MHLDVRAAMYGVAGLVTAWTVIYRGLVRPLVHGMRRLGDELAGLRESTLLVREVVQYVAGFVVYTEGRLLHLEETVGIDPPTTTPTYMRHKNALDWLEGQALRRDRRATDKPEEREE
jgi:hypothetical protein